MKLAKHLMTPNPRTIQSGIELRDVVKTFVEYGITSVPVSTPDGNIIGLLSELGLVKAFLQQQLKGGAKEKVIHHAEVLEEIIFIDEEAPVNEVVKEMIKAPTHRVLVRKNEQRLVGIISPKDILCFLSGEDKKSIDLRAKLRETEDNLKRMLEKLRDTKSILAQYKDLYQDTPVMMHSVNEKGLIIMANKKIHEVLGYDPGELINEPMQKLYAKSVHHEAIAGLKKVISDGRHYLTYTTMLSKAGVKVRVDIASSSLLDVQNKFIGTITCSREVDSDNLLRALHGTLDDKKSSDEELAELLEKLKLEED